MKLRCQRIPTSFSELVFHHFGLFVQHPTELFSQESKRLLELAPVAIGQRFLSLLLQPHQTFSDLANFAWIAAGEALLVAGVTLFPVLSELLVKAGEIIDNLVRFFFCQNLSDLVFEVVSSEAKPQPFVGKVERRQLELRTQDFSFSDGLDGSDSVVGVRYSVSLFVDIIFLSGNATQWRVFDRALDGVVAVLGAVSSLDPFGEAKMRPLLYYNKLHYKLQIFTYFTL